MAIHAPGAGSHRPDLDHSLGHQSSSPGTCVRLMPCPLQAGVIMRSQRVRHRHGCRPAHPPGPQNAPLVFAGTSPAPPASRPLSSAHSRHGVRTGHPAHTCLAWPICGSAGPAFPTGKNSSGSTPRHAASSRQCALPFRAGRPGRCRCTSLRGSFSSRVRGRWLAASSRPVQSHARASDPAGVVIAVNSPRRGAWRRRRGEDRAGRSGVRRAEVGEVG